MLLSAGQKWSSSGHCCIQFHCTCNCVCGESAICLWCSGAAQFIIYLVECTAFLGMYIITMQHLHRKCNQYNLVDCSICPVEHQRQECYPIVGTPIAFYVIPLQCSALQRDLLQECNPVQDSSIRPTVSGTAVERRSPVKIHLLHSIQLHCIPLDSFSLHSIVNAIDCKNAIQY